MIGLYHHDIEIARQVCSILTGRASRANHEASAVSVEQHRSLAIVRGRRPDIQEQAIFGRFRLVRPGWLDGGRAEVQRIAYTWPRLQFGRPAKSSITRNPSRIGN